MNNSTKLKLYRKVLRSTGVESVIDNSEECLKITLGNDEKGRPRSLMLKIDSQIRGGDHSQHPAERNQYMVVTSFEVQLPFSATAKSALDVYRCLAMVNNSVVLPGFVLNEAAEYTIVYRHNMVTLGWASPAVVTSIIGTILLLLDSLSHQIEWVAEGTEKIAILALSPS